MERLNSYCIHKAKESGKKMHIESKVVNARKVRKDQRVKVKAQQSRKKDCPKSKVKPKSKVSLKSK